MKICLHIDRMIVEGFQLQATDGRALQSAVQAELGRLLSEHGLHHTLQQGGAVPSVQADALHAGARAAPRQLGAEIARSVYGGIGNHR